MEPQFRKDSSDIGIVAPTDDQFWNSPRISTAKRMIHTIIGLSLNCISHADCIAQNTVISWIVYVLSDDKRNGHF